MDFDLMSEDETIHLKSRSYQTQLEEIAVEKNTIIHLPTGSGKTFIAIRLIKRFKKSLQKPWGLGGKRCFFLVNTVPLVNQQKTVIEKLCPVNGVGGYSGEDQLDYWNKSKWDEELMKYQVVVMTSQILCDMLTHRYIRIEDINLIIFDECHHAVDDHPMRSIMKHFDNCPEDKQPRVLGLTATLLNANVSMSKVESTLRQLETTFHAAIATVDELGEVLSYSANPYETVQTYSPTHTTEVANEAIQLLEQLQSIITAVKLPLNREHNIVLEFGQEDITSDTNKIQKTVRNMVSSMISHIKELGVYGGSIAILACIVILERLKRKCTLKELEQFYKIVVTHLMEAQMVLLDGMHNETGYEKIVKHSSPKVLLMLNILKEYNPKYYKTPGVLMKVNQSRKPLSGIIFTQQRFTAKALFNLLKDVKQANPEDFGFLKHDFVVGLNVNPYKVTREDHYKKKTSQKALLKFGNNDLNCLISTSVIEEGIDIPQCLLVMRYDPPLEYRSYIQSKGRARSAESAYVILMDQTKKNKFMIQYEKFQTTELFLHNILLGNTDKRIAPSSDDIQQDLYEDDKIPPYVTKYGNRLSAASAISLLHRYCNSLPHDQFSVISPMWIQEHVIVNNLKKIIITVVLPITCPVKEKIKGAPCFNIRSAKRSAAIRACIKLHQMGELDEVTLLPRSYGVVNFDQKDIKSCFPNWIQEEIDPATDCYLKPGSKKMVRKHSKVFPSLLKGHSNWKSGQNTFYLHIIKLKTAFDEPVDTREKALFNLLHRSEGYGLLTASCLPVICDFPMFLTVGEVMTSLEVNYAVIQLDTLLFESIKEFHLFIFDQILEVTKKFNVFDGKDNCVYVVPVQENNGYDIDWHLMQTYKEVRSYLEVPSYEERKTLSVSKEAYMNAVVTPWYNRGSILADRYIVSDVREYMTPMSLFESSSFNTYADYYATKYNLEILGSKAQPLLEVRNISSRMNCLMPRAATIKAFTEKQKKQVSAVQGDDKPKGFVELFIPEFCHKYDFPGVLWYKAILLPSIVHRVFMLLVAHELREEIVKGTGYGKTHLQQAEFWLPLEVNIQIATKSLLSQVEEPKPVNTIDRINNPIDESAPRGLNIVSMRETIYQLQNKKIDREYPWDEKMEPVDIERNLLTITVMDIECYDEFMTAKMVQTAEIPEAKFSPRPVTSNAAILPPPLKYNQKINFLTLQPTGRGPELRDILIALTTINSRDNFNLECVETLGDSFLKFVASLYLFHKFPQLNEGQLTNIKCRLIGNRNLYYAGANIQLGGRMKVEPFSPRNDFLVPGFFVPESIASFIKEKQIRPNFVHGLSYTLPEILTGQLSPERSEEIKQRFLEFDGAAEVEPLGRALNSMQCYVKAQAASDKSVADCVEALIGTFLLSGGILGSVKLLEWMKILPQADNFAGLLKKKASTVLTENVASVRDVSFLLNSSIKEIENILQYTFKDPSLLLEAMSHASYIRNRLTRSYERLEFLGDAILDFLITAHIFENNKDLAPGEITDLRSALVNNVTFASYVVRLGLHKYLCSELNPFLEKAIVAFAEHQEQRGHEVIEEVLYLIDEDECQIAEYVEVPKVLSDIFESLTGAMYLDSGGDLEAVWVVIYRIMHKEIAAFSARIPQQPVRLLYENIHACASFGEPKMTENDVPKVMMPVTITKQGRQHTVYGFGNNKFQAKRAAAKLALKILAF